MSRCAHYPRDGVIERFAFVAERCLRCGAVRRLRGLRWGRWRRPRRTRTQ